MEKYDYEHDDYLREASRMFVLSAESAATDIKIEEGFYHLIAMRASVVQDVCNKLRNQILGLTNSGQWVGRNHYNWEARQYHEAFAAAKNARDALRKATVLKLEKGSINWSGYYMLIINELDNLEHAEIVYNRYYDQRYQLTSR